ncbi:winged helix-turn-helix protein DUF2582 [Hypnocyclicus thermotrophus]|uniref:Winged helix-turn-helix protein DUF2582 n=1 Tax=Hypnocyclicus thermotrophus TaxID=1627895 RepID=A0AA46E0P1_9FUSO|nr:winged helix-turn-helix domain-containing protein [Hypnocyclicus thermotrophus]TDT72591.1 winged helix-turn-helix protein DUF2582 [Hypnocyclicus thermotrophus]
MKFSNEKIGKNAGKVWNHLNTNPNISFSKLQNDLKLTKDELLLTIGWLFREEKLIVEKSSRGFNFLLK